MKRRRIIVFALLATGLLACLILVLHLRQPVCNGRGVNAWIDDYIQETPDVSFSGSTFRIPSQQFDVEKRRRALEAIEKIGADAIPYIFKRVELEDSRWHKQYAEWWPKSSPRIRRFLPAPNKPLGSAGAAAMLSAIGPPAFPYSVQALNQTNSRVREASTYFIYWFATRTNSVSVALPLLTVAMGDTNVVVRLYAAGSLGTMGPEAASAIPAMTAALKASDVGGRFPGGRTMARAWILTALCKMGPEASNALPAIKPLLQDGDPYTRAKAAVALWRIDRDLGASLPILIAELPTTTPPSKAELVEAIGEMGPLAKSEFPALENELQELNPGGKYKDQLNQLWFQNYREKLTNALFKIDPEAAAKLLRN